MTDISPAKASSLFTKLFVAAFLCVATACKPVHDGSAESSPAASSSTATASVPDPVAEAHVRGRQWALNNKFTLVTDCGALEDPDERFGCADYVNNLPR